MLKGRMDFRIENERRSMSAGDVAVIPGDAPQQIASLYLLIER